VLRYYYLAWVINAFVIFVDMLEEIFMKVAEALQNGFYTLPFLLSIHIWFEWSEGIQLFCQVLLTWKFGKSD